MTVQEVLHLLYKHIKFITCFVLVAFIGATIYMFFFARDYYTSSATLYNVESGSRETALSSSDLLISEKLLADYQQIIKSRRVLDAVSQKAGTEIPPSSISVSSVTGTHVIKLSVTANSASTAAEWANLITEQFVVAVEEIVNVDNISVIDPAVPDTSPAGPNRLQYILLAGIGGLILSVGLVLVHAFLDTSIHNIEDAERILGIPVLAGVPKFKSQKRLVLENEYDG